LIGAALFLSPEVFYGIQSPRISCWLGGLAGGSLLLWTVRRELSAPSVLVFR